MPSKVDKLVLTRSQDRRTKLSDKQVEEIKQLYADGYTQKEIGKKFGVCQSTIGYIVSKKSKETLRNYRLENPPKRRTKEESKLYMRNLRKYKKEIEEKNKMNKENNIVDFQMETVKKNAPEILAELYRRHEETGECGIYDITPDGKLGEKLYDL